MQSSDFDKGWYIDSLRLSKAERAKLVTDFAARGSRSADERRKQPRLPYDRQAGLIVQMHHPGGSMANYLVRARNLSSGGIAFFHGSFVHMDTRCAVALLTTDNKVIRVEGRVVRCQHVRKHIHDVGVAFEKTICLRNFLGSAVLKEGEAETSSPLPRLSGEVLYVEDSVSDQELLSFHLANVGVKMRAVPNGLAAVDLAERVRFDAVVVNAFLPMMSGLEVAGFLRSGGYGGPIIALTADESVEIQQEAMESGCTAVLIKPYEFSSLMAVLALHLPRQSPQESRERELLSTHWPDVRMRPLIRTFLTRLRGEVQEMQKLLGAGKSGVILRKLCLEVKGSAGSYGFGQISQVAGELLSMVMEGAEGSALTERVAVLAGLAEAAAQSARAASEETGGEESKEDRGAA